MKKRWYCICYYKLRNSNSFEFNSRKKYNVKKIAERNINLL